MRRQSLMRQKVVLDLVPPPVNPLGAIGFLVAVQRLGMTGKAPSSLIC